ncbi:MAG: hypothetical protein JO362_02880 [Streptomycetaceae bacterium]|nr:hypothetical protein [Streptomycetaceae bacterium]
MAAHENQVLDFPDLAAALTYLAFRVHRKTTGVRGGYWRRETDDPDDLDYIHSLMGYIADHCGALATDDGEPANTAPVDSPVYLRHLARYRAALDPFVTCCLAAAEGAGGERDFAQHTADPETGAAGPSVPGRKQSLPALSHRRVGRAWRARRAVE